VPWLVGIDEAGYGPNLGPFVMSAAACRVPDGRAGADLWQVLRAAVRRKEQPADGRLLVEDSKLVYSPTRGLRDLETAVLALGSRDGDFPALPLQTYLNRLEPVFGDDLIRECWYAGDSPLPLVARAEEVASAALVFERACRENGVAWHPTRSVIVCPARFNDLVHRWKSKGAVLGEGLIQLLGSVVGLPGEDEVLVVIDKHGGRNRYAAQLQDSIPRGTVRTVEEAHQRSVYQVEGLGRGLRLTFQPRADAEHFCVALASMVSKYLREVCMHEFNRFWRSHVPDLKPTAGYPGDAERFYQVIRPLLERLNLPEAAVWRAR
jgi:ribonuclease HII